MNTRGAVHAHPLQGVLLILLSAACFASLDSTARGLSQPDGRWDVPVLLILRYTVQAAVMAVALTPRGFRVGVSEVPVAARRPAAGHQPVLVLRRALHAGARVHGDQQGHAAAGNGARPTTAHFWTGFVGTVLMWAVLAVAAASQGLDATLALLHRLPASAWPLMGACGLFGTVGHLFLILALGKARAATLVPFVDVQIAFAALIAYLFFDHLPDRWAWVGMTVIALCGAASAALNLRRPGAATPAAAVDVLPE